MVVMVNNKKAVDVFDVTVDTKARSKKGAKKEEKENGE